MQTWAWISYCQHSVTWNGMQLAYFVASSFCYRQFNRIWISHYRDACEQLMTYSRFRGISSALFWDIIVPSYLAPSLFFSCRLANWKNFQYLRKVSHTTGQPLTFASLGKSVSWGMPSYSLNWPFCSSSLPLHAPSCLQAVPIHSSTNRFLLISDLRSNLQVTDEFLLVPNVQDKVTGAEHWDIAPSAPW